MAASACPGCGAVLPDADGPQHPYMLGSAACWALFGVLLAAQYADPQRMAFHQLVVDAYAVQHPGDLSDLRAVQSVGVHLMTLQLFLEEDEDPAVGPALHNRMVERPVFTPLVPPDDRGRLTAASVPTDGPIEAARNAAWSWVAEVWRAWSAHHATVRRWTAESGLSGRRGVSRS